MHGLGRDGHVVDRERRSARVEDLKPGRRGCLGEPGGASGDFSFVQISDSHIGFNKPANTDVVATLRQAIAKINALPAAPDFILHTGDLSHLSEPAEFDTLDQMIRGTKAGRRTRARSFETLWFGHRAQWPYPPDAKKG